MLALIVVYLVIASVNDLASVPSRVIRWASIWNRPVLSVVVMVCLTWTWCGQAQRLWASAHALVNRNALHLHPATGHCNKHNATQLNCCKSIAMQCIAALITYKVDGWS